MRLTLEIIGALLGIIGWTLFYLAHQAGQTTAKLLADHIHSETEWRMKALRGLDASR
jgi:hypothetical protein